MIYNQCVLSELLLCQLLETFVLHRAEHIVIKFSDDGQSDEVKHDRNCVIGTTNNANVSKFDAQARCCLQKAREPRNSRRFELVGMVQGVLHHFEAC